jgi:hypothetical protein
MKREELIQFAKWFEKKDHGETSHSAIVDRYLASLSPVDKGQAMKLHEIQLVHDEPYFRKMKVENGFMYNFYDTNTDNYHTEWIFVPDAVPKAEIEKPMTAREFFMGACGITELEDIYTLHYSDLFLWMEGYSALRNHIPDVSSKVPFFPEGTKQYNKVEMPSEEIEKKLLSLFGFTEDGVDAENQNKIFEFMDWFKRLNKLI